MRLLMYSPTFWPNGGGIEDIGHVVARGLASRGHEVCVVTPTPASTERETNYQIVRNPSKQRLWQLAKTSDLVHSNGISLAAFPAAMVAGKPFTWTHHGYQLQCIDGAGWVNGRPAPLAPWDSFWFFASNIGLVTAIKGGIKLALRRAVSNMVAANIASSKHLLHRQPCANQIVLFNPFDDTLFYVSPDEATAQLDSADAAFTFIGRLITEKGVDDLLYAFASLANRSDRKLRLKIVGDGPERANLEALARKLGIEDLVCWKGFLLGDACRAELNRSGICVIPSAWEEPGAVTVMNLMAAGKPLIVSQRGFLSECAEDACLVFPNQDRLRLAEQMERLMNDRNLQLSLLNAGLDRVKQYTPESCILAYEAAFQNVLSKRVRR